MSPVNKETINLIYFWVFETIVNCKSRSKEAYKFTYIVIEISIYVGLPFMCRVLGFLFPVTLGK